MLGPVCQALDVTFQITVGWPETGSAGQTITFPLGIISEMESENLINPGATGNTVQVFAIGS